jgi:hypothetical protein
MASSAQAWMGVGLGGLVGLGATTAVVLAARQWRIARLTGDNVRGVACSIGRLPINFDRPVEAKEMPDKASLRLPPEEYDPKGKIDRDWMDKWFQQYEGHHPEHAALMRAVARVLNSQPELPAACRKLAAGTKAYQYGYDQHRHGDHTLLEHSWNCASVGIWLTKNGFQYDGVHFKDKYKNAVGFIGKKDGAYQFKPWDPLIGLICFAHDIGKTETFRMTKDKKVEVIEPAHDSVGARMLARMDEFWALPFEDRMTLTLAIGHYHKPSEMPLRRDADSANKAVALSDRTMAMLNLVILSDEEAGSIENKKSEEEGKDRPKEIIEAEYRANLWEAFRDLLNESQRVHTDPSKFRIGQKNTIAEGTIITLKEGDLRKELLDKMQLRKSEKEAQTASGAAQITEDLLEVLDERGCLVKSSGGIQVEAKKAIWKVEFMGKDKTRVGDVIATWPYAILINPEEHFPKLASGPDAQSLPRVTAIADPGSMLEEKKTRPDAPRSAFESPPLEAPNGGFLLAEGTQEQRKGKKKGNQQQDARPEPLGVEASENVVDLNKVRHTKMRPPEEGGASSAAAVRAAEVQNEVIPQNPRVGQRETAAESQQTEASAVAQQDEVRASNALSNRGSNVMAGLMDELDPVDVRAAPAAEKQSPANQTDEAETVIAGGSPAADQLALVQKLLKSKLGRDETAASEPAPAANTAMEHSEVPADATELAIKLRGPLAKIQAAAKSKKLAAEELEDGRQAYSLEALSAVVPEIRAQLAEPAMVRKLMGVAKYGKKVPVCVIYRQASGVTLVVINPAEVRRAQEA